jgi:transposase
MAGYSEGVDRQQATLFPERLDELVPGDALVRVIDRFVDQLDVQAAGFIRAKPAGIGRPGYRPGDLWRLFLYGYMNGVRSSRALERACWVNLELAWLPTPRQQAALGTPSSAGCSPTSRRLPTFARTTAPP